MSNPNNDDNDPDQELVVVDPRPLDDLMEELAEQAQRLFGDDNDPDQELPLDAEQRRE